MAEIYDIKTTSIGSGAFKKAVDACASALCEGGIACVPTDSVYGLSASILETRAAEKIFLLKERPLTQKMPLLLGSIEQLVEYGQDVTQEAQALAKQFWPGPLTLIVEASDAVPVELMEEDGSIALRVSASQFLQTLIKKTGPLATTSANIHGQAPAATIDMLDDILLESVDVVVDAGETTYQKPSTIIDVRQCPVVLAREGALPFAAIKEALRA